MQGCSDYLSMNFPTHSLRNIIDSQIYKSGQEGFYLPEVENQSNMVFRNGSLTAQVTLLLTDSGVWQIAELPWT